MLKPILGGLVVAALAGCGGPSTLQCRLDAVSRLPLSAVEDPDSLTLGDVRTLATELRACRQEASDAGAR
jgi:hypothetical protein